MIVAYTQGVPLLGLSWSPKTRDFFRIIGAEERRFELLLPAGQREELLRAAGAALSGEREDRAGVLAEAERSLRADLDRITKIIDGSAEQPCPESKN